MEWQPIETAPKELKYSNGANRYGEFIIAWHPLYTEPQRVRWWWRADSDARNFITDGSYATHPTHWMPLPSPPTTAEPGSPAGS